MTKIDEVIEVEPPSETRDDSEIEIKGRARKGRAFKMFGLETKSSLRLDFRTKAGLYTSL